MYPQIGIANQTVGKWSFDVCNRPGILLFQRFVLGLQGRDLSVVPASRILAFQPLLDHLHFFRQKRRNPQAIQRRVAVPANHIVPCVPEILLGLNLLIMQTKDTETVGIEGRKGCLPVAEGGQQMPVDTIEIFILDCVRFFV